MAGRQNIEITNPKFSFTGMILVLINLIFRIRSYQIEAIYCLIDLLLGSITRIAKRINDKMYSKSLQVLNI
jgi:hypothetical protein